MTLLATTLARTCHECTNEIAVGAPMRWDPNGGTVTCSQCVERSAERSLIIPSVVSSRSARTEAPVADLTVAPTAPDSLGDQSKIGNETAGDVENDAATDDCVAHTVTLSDADLDALRGIDAARSERPGSALMGPFDADVPTSTTPSPVLVGETPPLHPSAILPPPVGPAAASVPPPRGVVAPTTDMVAATAADPVTLSCEHRRLLGPRVPGRGRVPIDRIIIGSNGIAVAVSFGEATEVRVSRIRRRQRLAVDGRDRTKQLREIEVATEKIAAVLRTAGGDRIPVIGVAMFPGAVVAQDSTEVDGVHIVSNLSDFVGTDGGPLEPAAIDAIAELIDRAIPAAD